MRRVGVLVAVATAMAAVLVGSGALALVRTDDVAPAVAPASTSDAAALARAGTGDLGDTITVLQEHLGAQPADARGWATLGVAYVEQARITGDPSYYPKATGVLARSLRIQPDDNSVALAGQAALASARHEFAAALALARRSLDINPYEVGALSIQVDALTELGRYVQARRALAQADRRRPSVQVFARYSYAEELRGHTARAQALLRRALASVTNAADKAFLLSLLADLERRDGRLAQAAADLRLARRADPEHVPALVGLARLELARGDLASATRRWRQVVQQAPLPAYLLELGEIYQATGRAAKARAQYGVLRATVRLQARSGVSTDLETARFQADHGSAAGALRAARSAWQQAPSIWSADALAWALHRNGRDRAAMRASLSATRLGTPDPMLWLHRGFVEAGLGLDVAAQRHLRRGLALDPALNPWQVARAQRLLERVGGSR